MFSDKSTTYSLQHVPEEKYSRFEIHCLPRAKLSSSHRGGCDAKNGHFPRKLNGLGTLTFMTINQLSDSTQDYLKAIWLAGEWSDEPITATSIAQRVGVTMSTTSDALRRLREA